MFSQMHMLTRILLIPIPFPRVVLAPVCSASGLLPRAVRPLLAARDSPLAALYAECKECKTLAARERSVMFEVRWFCCASFWPSFLTDPCFFLLLFPLFCCCACAAPDAASLGLQTVSFDFQCWYDHYDASLHC